MQVILLQDVARVGRKYDVVNVSNGYANNLLFPRKLAELASPEKIAELTKRKEAARVAEDARSEATKEKLASLAEQTITFEVKADDQGHLFKKIRQETIADLLKDEHGLDVSKESVLLEVPIHEVGEHQVDIEIFGVRTTLTVEVVAV
jgi:large subunit ribosomal protein L9